MKKRIINKPEEKLNIVILSNDEYDILVKGVSRCHPNDKYNEELGIKIANTRAWLKYYDKLQKMANKNLEWTKEMYEWYSKRVNECEKLKEFATNKYNEIKQDHDNTLQNI